MHVLNLANAYLIIKNYSKNKQFDVHEQFGYLWCSIAILVLQKFRPKASRSNSIVISYLNQVCMYMPITAILNLSKWSLFFGPLNQVTKVYIIISYQYYFSWQFCVPSNDSKTAVSHVFLLERQIELDIEGQRDKFTLKGQLALCIRVPPFWLRPPEDDLDVVFVEAVLPCLRLWSVGKERNNLQSTTTKSFLEKMET